MGPRNYMTIGEVVDRLSGVYPDLTISKVRFLEEEGLIAPERTPGGYRKFSKEDLARVEVILKLQRDHFLPLAIIGERLADYDHGKPLPEFEGTSMTVASAADAAEDEDGFLSLDDAQPQAGIPASFLKELAEFGLVAIVDDGGTPSIARTELPIAHAAWDLHRFGVEPRHLRMYQTSSEREAALFKQILMPAVRHRTPETRQKLADTVADLQQLTGDLKARLLRRAIRDAFGDTLE